MSETILPPKSNTVFQLLFGDPRNIDLLADFLKAAIDIPEDEYRVTTCTGQIVHVEIQRNPFPAMRDRIIFYDANMLAGQIGEGKDYMLKRVVTILITDYVLISESPFYHHRFTLYDSGASVEFTDLLEIRTFELPKLPESPDVYLWNWLRFFRAETKEELEMVANASPVIRKATAKVKKLSKDERARLLHLNEVMARMYELSMRDGAMQEGIEKGRTEGRAEGRTEGRAEGLTSVVLNMLQRNRPVAEIAEYTGLSLDEIKKRARC